MRASLSVCAVVAMLVLGVVSATPTEKPAYSSKYDNVDVDRILNNGRILTNYIKCMMDEGPCTQDGRELKKTLPDALSSGCTKCSDKQKGVSDKVITHLMKHRKTDWERLTKKYDPKGDYQKRYDEALRAAKAAAESPAAPPAVAVAAAVAA